jgi:hypothetical protein
MFCRGFGHWLSTTGFDCAFQAQVAPNVAPMSRAIATQSGSGTSLTSKALMVAAPDRRFRVGHHSGPEEKCAAFAVK